MNKSEVFESDKFKKTLSLTSLDKSRNVCMTGSQLMVVDFDEVKNQYVSSLGTRAVPAPNSNDALHVDRNDRMYFVEFKNGKVDKYKLMQKNYDSTIILSTILDENIANLKERLEYILVYDEEKNPDGKDLGVLVQPAPSRDKIGKSFAKQSKVNFIKFNQGFFVNYLFSKVHTITKSEFEEKFVLAWETDSSES